MSHASFKVVYDGPALENNEMDVRDLAPALLAMGDLLDCANSVLNKGKAKISVSVRGSFKTGCFGINFIVNQSMVQHIQDLFTSNQVSAALNILTSLGFATAGVGGLVKFLLWLRGRKPTNIKMVGNDKCDVFVDTEHILADRITLDMFRNLKLRQAFEAVLKPLEIDGIDSFAITQDDGVNFVDIGKVSLPFFKAPAAEDELLEEAEYTSTLQFVSVSFREENKWRFTDGGSPFYASVQDQGFLKRVHDNEASFSKGDLLKVMMRKRQWLSGDKMTTEYEILEVLEHRKAAVQIKLPMDVKTEE